MILVASLARELAIGSGEEFSDIDLIQHVWSCPKRLNPNQNAMGRNRLQRPFLTAVRENILPNTCGKLSWDLLEDFHFLGARVKRFWNWLQSTVPNEGNKSLPRSNSEASRLQCSIYPALFIKQSFFILVGFKKTKIFKMKRALKKFYDSLTNTTCFKLRP